MQPLTFLINSSLKSGVFPSELKLARVVPILKAGDSSDLTNYRPISVLTFFAKVFEKIVYNKVIVHNNNLYFVLETWDITIHLITYKIIVIQLHKSNNS